jgi:hypothetical protein
MKLLSAKNKKYAILFGAIVGGLFIAQIIYDTYRSGAKTAGEYGTALMNGLKSLVSFNSLLILMTVGAAIIGSPVAAGASFAVAIGTLTSGVGLVTTINTTYLPEFFSYTAATQLTGVKITVQGEGVIFDGDASGLTHWGVNRLQGQFTNTYTFRIANGLITGKNVIWEFTNSAAQTPIIYADNWEVAGRANPRVGKQGGQRSYLQAIRQAVLANSGQDFDDFATLSLPSVAATDEINVLYSDGCQQKMNRADVLAKLQFTQNVISTPIYMIDNFGQTIQKVSVIAGAAQTAYVQRWALADQGGMINMKA